MAKARVFTSFDFDNDQGLRTLLVGQSINKDSPFEMADWSVKVKMEGDWKAKVRKRIKAVDQMVVLCGTQTHNASGVSIELKIAQEEKIPYFLLKGHATKICHKPKAAKLADKMYNWTWPNLKTLIGGGR